MWRKVKVDQLAVVLKLVNLSLLQKKFKQYLTDDGVGEKETQVNLEYTRDGFAALVGSMMAQLRIYDEEANKWNI